MPPALPVCHAVKPEPPSRPAHVCLSRLFPAPKPRRRCGSRPSGALRTHSALAGCGAVLIGAGLGAQSGLLGVLIMCQLSLNPLISHWGWGAKMPAVAEESPSTPLDGLRKVTLPRGLCAAHCAVNGARLEQAPQNLPQALPTWPFMAEHRNQLLPSPLSGQQCGPFSSRGGSDRDRG